MLATSTAAIRLGAIAVAGLLIALGFIAAGAQPAVAGPASPIRWQRLIEVDRPIDLAGPRADGTLVQAAKGRLFTISPDFEDRAPFARGPRGYRTEAGEPYVALSADTEPGPSGCRFRQDDLFALEPRDDPAVIRIGPSGHASPFARFSDRFRLDGIAFDRVGSFGHRLLVLAVDDKRTSLIAIDCAGRKRMISANGPRVEGGIEVAPPNFGAFAGHLIAPDEYSGGVFAFAPTGEVSKLVDSGLPAGRDIGVESLGFVPSGFAAPGLALVSDQGREEGEPGRRGAVLAMGAEPLAAAGAVPGDLLVATEGGAKTIRVRCAATCDVDQIASGPTTAHVEGHILFVPGPFRNSLAG